MRSDRRAEWISGVLCVSLTVACFWSTLELARLSMQAFRDCGCTLPDATQYVFDVAEAPFSLRLMPWLSGVLLAGAGVVARRRPRFDTAGLVSLFLAPLAPVLMLAFSATALLLPMISLATSGSLNS